MSTTNRKICLLVSLLSLVIIFTAACKSSGSSATPVTPTNKPAPTSTTAVNKDAVNTNQKFETKLEVASEINSRTYQCAEKIKEPSSEQSLNCFTTAMQQLGASTQAIEFTNLIYKEIQSEGYLTEFSEHGKIDLITVMHPMMANSNEQKYFVNGEPKIISVGEDEKFLQVSEELIKKAPLYDKLHKKYPDMSVNGSVSKFVKMEQTANGGQRFIMEFEIVNGCRACEVVGKASYAFEFDPNGKKTDIKLHSLK